MATDCDDPATVKAELHWNLTRMLDDEFDTLLFAHADPVLAGGRTLLETSRPRRGTPMSVDNPAGRVRPDR